jgi:ubiquinone/menaquinone biosynthesis C-methylase UbiE
MNDRTFKHTEAHKLEDPERLKWLSPADVLARLELREGMRVADIGAGTGYFTIPVARAIGASGRVFAVDLQSEMLDLMREKLEEPNAPGNISLHQGEATSLPLQPGSVEVVLYANIWHELLAALRVASRIAVPGGAIAILDWREDVSPPPGPPQDHRLPMDAVANFLSVNGCGSVLRDTVGQFGYIVTARLPLR